MMMRGIWLQNRQMRYRQDLPVPEPLAREALVKVLIAGLCATDLEMLKGYYPFTGIPGHEFVGQVMEAVDKPGLIGRRVVASINIGCGACDDCRSGNGKHCRRRQVVGLKERNGAFAEYISLPIANLHLVPDSLSDETAVFTELLAAAGQFLEKIKIKADQSVLIVGAGRLGQLTARVVQRTSCRLHVVARYGNQRDLLDQAQISWIAENQLKADTYDLVIDTTGVAQGFDLCCRCVRPGGTIVLKSTYTGKLPVSMAELVVDEITVVGSRCGSMRTGLEWLARGYIDPRPLIQQVLGFDQITQVIQLAGRQGSMQILFSP